MSEEIDNTQKTTQTNNQQTKGGNTRKKTQSTTKQTATQSTTTKKEENAMTEKQTKSRKPGIKQIRQEMDVQIRLMEMYFGNEPSVEQQERLKAVKASREMLEGNYEALNSLFN